MYILVIYVYTPLYRFCWSFPFQCSRALYGIQLYLSSLNSYSYVGHFTISLYIPVHIDQLVYRYGQLVRHPPVLPLLGGARAMQLTVQPDIPLEVELIENEHEALDGMMQRYALLGPQQQIDMLADKVGGAEHDEGTKARKRTLCIQGPLSPLAPVTLPVDKREAAGIPRHAHWFAFGYPGEYQWMAADAGDGEAQTAWQGLERHLETLDLAKDMWGFFLLVGGFVYFDEHKKAIRVNALTLVPSPNVMNFAGPGDPCPQAIEALWERQRIVSVTLDALQTAGFKAFGWVFGNESIGGATLGPNVANEHGAFVYLMRWGHAIYLMLSHAIYLMLYIACGGGTSHAISCHRMPSHAISCHLMRWGHSHHMWHAARGTSH